ANLSPDDGPARDVFVRDLQANTTTFVSRATGAGGAAGDGDSANPSISGDGRLVAFGSFADNLHPADPDPSQDRFAPDVQAHVTTLGDRATGAGGVKANNFTSTPAISAGGRFVAFESSASNLDPADHDIGDDLFRRDLQTNTTVLVSRASGAAGAKGNDASTG